VGYPEGSKGYKVFDNRTKTISIFRDVIFAEDQFEDGNQPCQAREAINKQIPATREEECSDIEDQSSTQPLRLQEDESQANHPEKSKQTVEANQNDSVGIRRSTRLKEYAMVAEVVAEEPTSYKEAQRSKEVAKWDEAMSKEIASIKENETWEEVRSLPEGANLVSSRWVYKAKLGPNGEITKYKARIVAKGYSQVYGVDYEETFAPVAKITSLRAILAWAASMDKEIEQMDVVTAFLNPKLEEDIYMELPDGVEASSKIVKLRKGLYGLKQSGRVWYLELHNHLTRMGFDRSHADHSVYSKITNGELMVIVVWVDDIIIITDKTSSMKNIKNQFRSKFKEQYHTYWGWK